MTRKKFSTTNVINTQHLVSFASLIKINTKQCHSSWWALSPIEKNKKINY